MTSVPQQQTFAFGRPPVTPAPPQRQNVVIEAGAGTGKTTAIVAEVLELLLGEVDVQPERIVLVTFTEKAAGEIADRIEGALNDIQEQLAAGEAVRWPKSDHPLFEVTAAQQEACRRAVERQLARIDGLRSQTIHSFCQSLLRQYPIEAGVDPQFRIIEGFDRSLLYGQVYDEWLDDETRLRPRHEVAREWEALLEHCSYLFFARNYIFNLVDRRHLLLDERYDIGSIAELEPALQAALETIRQCGRNDSRITTYVRQSASPAPGSSIEAWIEFFAPIAADLRKADLRDESRCRDAIRLLRGKDKGTSVFDLLISHRAAEALLSLTRRFLLRLDEEKRRRGVLDFDDLLIRTRVLLGDDAVLQRIRQQFDFIFVDEFQDTDRIQAEIIDRLARDHGGTLVAGKTIVVGDPKQSIYAFRRADPETYAQFTTGVIAAGGRRELLVDQYRSEPQLVEALNAIGERLFAMTEDDDPNVFRPEYHPLRAAKSAGPNIDDASVTLLACDAEESDDRVEEEAEAIASWIAARSEGDLRKFALLFRRRGRIDSYLDVFDRRGVDYVLPPMGLFLDRPAPVDLLAVLRAVAYRYDRGAGISAARTPYFALTDREITEGILNIASEPWNSFLTTLESFRAAAEQSTLTELIDHIVRTTGIEAVYGATPNGVRSLRHLEQVRSIAFAYDQKSGGSVRQFVEEIARRREIPEEVEPSLLDESSNAVRILTVHAAKGLEFETVILPDIEFTGGGQGPDVFTVDQPASLVIGNGLDSLSGVCRRSGRNALKDILGLRDQAETRRLFYVAITRAKRQVVIACNGPKTTRRGFGRFVAEVFNAKELTWPEEGQRDVQRLAIGPVALERMARRDRGETERPAVDEPIVACEVPQPPPLGTELPAAEIAIARRGSRNRAAGILLHRLLERWDGSTDPAPLLEALAVEQAAEERDVDLVRRRLATVKASEMFRRIALAETLGREMPISFLDENGAVADKRIDRLIREAEHDTVIDYKSGEPSASRATRDGQQVALYCRAVSRMTGRPCRGVLWYIDVENDAVVNVD